MYKRSGDYASQSAPYVYGFISVAFTLCPGRQNESKLAQYALRCRRSHPPELIRIHIFGAI